MLSLLLKLRGSLGGGGPLSILTEFASYAYAVRLTLNPDDLLNDDPDEEMDDLAVELMDVFFGDDPDRDGNASCCDSLRGCLGISFLVISTALGSNLTGTRFA